VAEHYDVIIIGTGTPGRYRIAPIREALPGEPSRDANPVHGDDGQAARPSR
jgi:hypothetical protein